MSSKHKRGSKETQIKNNRIKNGWHKVAYGEVYVRDGMVIHVSKFENGYSVSASLYKQVEYRGYVKIEHPVKFTTVRSGIYNGTYRINRW